MSHIVLKNVFFLICFPFCIVAIYILSLNVIPDLTNSGHFEFLIIEYCYKESGEIHPAIKSVSVR